MKAGINDNVRSGTTVTRSMKRDFLPTVLKFNYVINGGLGS